MRSLGYSLWRFYGDRLSRPVHTPPTPACSKYNYKTRAFFGAWRPFFVTTRWAVARFLGVCLDIGCVIQQQGEGTQVLMQKTIAVMKTKRVALVVDYSPRYWAIGVGIGRKNGHVQVGRKSVV